MNLEPFLSTIRRDLAAVAETAGPEGKAAADRMLLALEPALRLSALELLAQAADEVTAALPGGSVDVRLRGREPELVVAPPQPAKHRPALLVDDDPEGQADALVRVTLRIPESVKVRAEEQASRNGLSLNAWIVTVLRAATSRRAVNVDVDLTSIPLEVPRVDVLPERRAAGKA
jgi:hypothetical protein